MLLKISERIVECLERAAEARERASRATDPAQKSDFLDMELRWMRLVESYRFVEQANRFLDDAARNSFPRHLPVPKRDLSHATLISCEICDGNARLVACAPCTLSRGLREIWTFKCEVCGEELKRVVDP